jgi:hypothetical protein
MATTGPPPEDDSDVSTSPATNECKLDRTRPADELGAAMAGSETPYYAFRDEAYEFSLLIRNLRRKFGLARVKVLSVPSRRFRIIDASDDGLPSSALKYIAEHGYYPATFGVEPFKYESGRWFDHAYADFHPHNDALRDEIRETYEE